MSEENNGVLDTSVQDDVSVDSDNNDTLNDSADARYESQKTRAEKAEAKAKELKEQLEALKSGSDTKTVNEPQTTLSKDEAILYATGFTDEQIETAKKVAQLEGIGIREAVNSDYYKALEAVKKEQEETRQVNLKTSNKSPKVAEKKSLESKDLSRDEHKELFMKRLGR